MLPCIAEPRPEVSKYAPKMVTLHIDPDKIRDVIGKGGSVIQKIVAESGAKIDIDDDGTIHIASPDAESCEKAKKCIDDIVFVPGGGPAVLRDTAGIRDGGDAVETMGGASRAAAKQASLALLVLDGSRELTAEDEAAIALANTVPHLIVAVNKSDLPRALDVGALADRFDNVLSLSPPHRRGTGHADRRHRGAVPVGRDCRRRAADQRPSGRRRQPSPLRRGRGPRRPPYRHDPRRGAHRLRGGAGRAG